MWVKGAVCNNLRVFAVFNNFLIVLLPMCEQIIYNLKNETFPDFLSWL